jgi:hypothetical protein
MGLGKGRATPASKHVYHEGHHWIGSTNSSQQPSWQEESEVQLPDSRVRTHSASDPRCMLMNEWQWIERTKARGRCAYEHSMQQLGVCVGVGARDSQPSSDLTSGLVTPGWRETMPSPIIPSANSTWQPSVPVAETESRRRRGQPMLRCGTLTAQSESQKLPDSDICLPASTD